MVITGVEDTRLPFGWCVLRPRCLVIAFAIYHCTNHALATMVGKEKRDCHEDLIVTPREKRERTAQLRAARSTKGATPKSPCGISCSPPHAAATPTQSHTPAGIHCFQEFLQRGSRLGRWPGRSLWHCCFVLKQDSQRSSMAGKAFC